MASAFKVLFALFVAASALPQPELVRRSDVACEVIDDIISTIKANSVATPFCSSFLGIGTKTITSITFSTPAAALVTSSTVITRTVYQTVDNIITSQVFDTFTSTSTDTQMDSSTIGVTDLFTADVTDTVVQTSTQLSTDTLTATVTDTTTEVNTVSVTDLATATVTVTFVSTVTSFQTNTLTQTSTVLEPARKRQRDIKERKTAIPTPAEFKILGKKLLSAGCSCLGIPTPTTTTVTTSVLATATSTVPFTTSTTTTVIGTSSTTVAVTSDVTVDATVDVTSTAIAVSTDNVTVISSAAVTNTVVVSSTVDVSTTATAQATSQSTLDMTTFVISTATADVTTPFTAAATADVTKTVLYTTPAPCGTAAPNLVQDPGFNNGGNDGWTISSTGSGAYYTDGECSPDYYCKLLYLNGPGSITFAQTLQTVPGQTYDFSYYYVGGTTSVTVACTAGSTTLPINYSANPHAFNLANTTFVATSDQTDLACFAEGTSSSTAANVDIDDVSVTAIC